MTTRDEVSRDSSITPSIGAQFAPGITMELTPMPGHSLGTINSLRYYSL